MLKPKFRNRNWQLRARAAIQQKIRWRKLRKISSWKVCSCVPCHLHLHHFCHIQHFSHDTRTRHPWYTNSTGTIEHWCHKCFLPSAHQNKYTHEHLTRNSAAIWTPTKTGAEREIALASRSPHLRHWNSRWDIKVTGRSNRYPTEKVKFFEPKVNFPTCKWVILKNHCLQETVQYISILNK